MDLWSEEAYYRYEVLMLRERLRWLDLGLGMYNFIEELTIL